MAKIENTVAYPLVKPQANDYVVLTDVSDNNETKTCLVGDLWAFYGWKYFDRTLTAAEVLGAEAMPVILIPAQGAGVIVMPEIGELVAQTITNTSVPPDNFDCTNQAWIRSASSISTCNIYAMDENNINQSGFPWPLTTNLVYGSRAQTGDNQYGNDMTGMVNEPIVFTFDAGDGPTNGNGSIRITFRYRILSGFNL